MPFVYTRVSAELPEPSTASGYGFGDVQVGAVATLVSAGINRPGVYVHAGASAPTGRGFSAEDDVIPTGTGTWFLLAGASISLSLDPAVLTLSLSPSYGIPFTIDDERVEPGFSLSASLGASLALNDRFALGLTLSGNGGQAPRVGDIAVAPKWTESSIGVSKDLTSDSGINLSLAVPWRIL